MSCSVGSLGSGTTYGQELVFFFFYIDNKYINGIINKERRYGSYVFRRNPYIMQRGFDMSKLFSSIICLLLIVCMILSLAACGASGPSDETDKTAQTGEEHHHESESETEGEPSTSTYLGLFTGGNRYTLTGDYAVTDADCTHTGGTDAVMLSGIVAFDLGGKKLNLSGKTIRILSDETGTVVFQNGSVENGTLDIRVPNGDISFDNVTLAEDVTYILEAAPATIRMANASVRGKGTIKSNSNVEIQYTTMGEITLDGNATLAAGAGTEVGAITVSESAAGAVLDLGSGSKVGAIAMNAPASVDVKGELQSIEVSNTASSGAEAQTSVIRIAETAKVDTVELGSGAELSVSGEVGAITVSEDAAPNAAESISVSVDASATVTQVELKSSAKVNVAGLVASLKVSAKKTSEAKAPEITVTGSAVVSSVEIGSQAKLSVSGTVSSVQVAQEAEGAEIKLESDASVAQITISAENTSVSSEATGSMPAIYVADTVQNVSVEGADATVASADEMQELTEHIHIFIPTDRKAPTCTEAGYVVSKCECGETSRVDQPALGHNFNTYVVTKEPTETEDGIAVYKCARCGATEARTIPATGEHIRVNGLDALLGAIPEGHYYLEGTELLKVTRDDVPMTIQNVFLCAVWEDRQLEVTGRAKAVVGDQGTYDVYLSLKDGVISFYVVSVNEVHDAMMTISSLARTFLYEMMDVRMTDQVQIAQLLESVDTETVATFLNTDFGSGVVSYFASRTENAGGSVTYTLKNAKDLYEDLKAKTVAQWVAQFMDYEDFKSSVLALPDKKMSDAIAEIRGKLASFGIDDDVVMDFIGDMMKEYSGTDTFDFAAFLNEISTKTFAEFMGSMSQMSAEEFKADYLANVREMFGMLESASVIDILNSLIPEAHHKAEAQYTEPVPSPKPSTAVAYAADGAVAEGGTVVPADDSGETDEPKSVLEALLETYGDKIRFSLTVKDGLPVGVSFALTDEALTLSFDKAEGERIPTLSVVMNGEKLAELTRTDKGHELFVLLDFDDPGELTLFTEETDDKTEVHFSVNAERSTVTGEAGVQLTRKADGSFEKAVVSSTGSVSTLRGGAYPTTSAGTALPAVDVTEWVVGFTFGRDDTRNPEAETAAKADTYRELFTGLNVELEDKFSIRFIKTSEEDPGYYEITDKYGDEYVLASVNGIPDCIIAINSDCNDWIQVMLETVDFDLRFYMNAKTKEVATKSQHHFEVDIEFDGKDCEDGYTGTRTCANCGLTEEIQGWGHHMNYVVAETVNTPHGTVEAVRYECEYCGVTRPYSLEYDGHEHYFTSYEISVVSTEMILAKYGEWIENLVTYGEMTEEEAVQNVMEEMYGSNACTPEQLSQMYPSLDLSGIIAGDVSVQVCIGCGVSLARLTLFANGTGREEDCSRTDLTLLSYPGQKNEVTGEIDYPALERILSENTVSAHYYAGQVETKELSATAALAYVRLVCPLDPFTPDFANAEYPKCALCGNVSTVPSQVYLSRKSEDGQESAYFHVSLYLENGEITGGYGYGRTTEPNAITAAARRIGETLPAGLSGEVRYEGSTIRIEGNAADGTYYYAETYFRSKNPGEFTISYKTVRTGDLKTCTMVTTNTNYDSDGQPVSSNRNVSEWHDYVEEVIRIPSENCDEFGVRVIRRTGPCTRCGARPEEESSSVHEEIEHWHPSTVFVEDGDDDAYATYRFCPDCGSRIDLALTLTRDLILEEDIVIKAEGFELNLNGHTIDLNGHNFIVYGYDASSICIFDPNFYYGDEGGAVTGDGYLILFTNGGYIEADSFRLDSDFFFSDGDGLNTVFYAFEQATGQELETLREMSTLEPIEGAATENGIRVLRDCHQPYSFRCDEDGSMVSENSNAHSTEAVMILIAEMDEGQVLSFDYSVSSERSCDYFWIFAGNEEYLGVSGEDGGTFEYRAEESTLLILTLVYHKDSSVSSGDDRAVVSGIRLS